MMGNAITLGKLDIKPSISAGLSKYNTKLVGDVKLLLCNSHNGVGSFSPKVASHQLIAALDNLDQHHIIAALGNLNQHHIIAALGNLDQYQIIAALGNLEQHHIIAALGNLDQLNL